MILRISNGAKVTPECIYSLWLPLGFRLDLKDCYFISVASQNLISVSVLAQDRFVFNLIKIFILFIYEINWLHLIFLIDSFYHLHVDANVNLNEQVMNTVGQKRSRDEFNHKYLWHHRLGHIGEDRINRLKKDEILGSFDSESYPACESCLREKIIKLPFEGHRKRATELLVLVYIDVCGPFDVQTRDGYSYFITFTDDLS